MRRRRRERTSGHRLLAFQARYEQTARPFRWTFTRADLADLLAKFKEKQVASAA
jgi:hypothetical protein